jgi:hypothetical protein
MKQVILVEIDPKNYGQPIPDSLQTAMGELLGDMGAKGVLVGAEGLRPPKEGVRMSLAKGNRAITDGPFTEAKEVVGGFFLLDTATKEEAIEWTRRVLDVHVRHCGPDFECTLELRACDG